MFPRRSLEDLLREGVQAITASVREDVWAGVELYQQVSQSHPGIKIVILSVLSETEIRDQARERYPGLEFNCEFLRKGEDPRTIYRTIQNAARRSRRDKT
jgi:hypothetical protein